MIGKNQYDFQLVIRLNSDLDELCDGLFRKRVEKKDLLSKNDDGPPVQLSQQLNLPDGSVNFVSAKAETRLTNNSRIYLVGHGDPGSQAIGIDNNGRGYEVAAAAKMVKSFIPEGVKIKRLVLLCCYAGGNRFGEKIDDNGGVVGGGTVVEADQSFALRLYALVHDNVGSVTARNARVSVGERITGQGHHTFTKNIDKIWTHKDFGSKVMFSGMTASGDYYIQHTYGRDGGDD